MEKSISPIEKKFNEIISEFISLYGEPKTIIVDGKKITNINSYYSAFDKLKNAIYECFDKLNWNVTDYSNEIILLFEYARITEYNVVDYIAKTLKRKCKECVFKNLFAQLHKISVNKFDIDKVDFVLSDSLNIWIAGSHKIYTNDYGQMIKGLYYV